MRPDIHAGAQQKFGRPHLVKENEWPDHLSLRGWQRPPHGKAAEIPRAGDDDYVNRVRRMFHQASDRWQAASSYSPYNYAMGRFLKITMAGASRKPSMSALGSRHLSCTSNRTLNNPLSTR